MTPVAGTTLSMTVPASTGYIFVKQDGVSGVP